MFDTEAEGEKSSKQITGNFTPLKGEKKNEDRKARDLWGVGSKKKDATSLIAGGINQYQNVGSGGGQGGGVET